MALRLAIVIPVLDEAERIAPLLAEVVALAGVTDVVVVDGGSRDDTVARARGFAGVRVVLAARGRGQQLQAGATAARGDVLLFLHADVRLPSGAGGWIEQALSEPDVVAGAFRIRTVNDGAPTWVDRFLWFADVRARYTRYPYGDQAMFVRRTALERVGGVPLQPLMEDLELSRRLRRIGRIVTVPATVTVSGRRFVQRPLRSTVVLWVLPQLYRAGVSPERLVRLYGTSR